MTTAAEIRSENKPYCGQRIFSSGLVLSYIVIAVIIVTAILLVLFYKS